MCVMYYFYRIRSIPPALPGKVAAHINMLTLPDLPVRVDPFSVID